MTFFNYHAFWSFHVEFIQNSSEKTSPQDNKFSPNICTMTPFLNYLDPDKQRQPVECFLSSTGISQSLPTTPVSFSRFSKTEFYSFHQSLLLNPPEWEVSCISNKVGVNDSVCSPEVSRYVDDREIVDIVEQERRIIVRISVLIIYFANN